MPNSTIKLSDGTTTIDINTGDYSINRGGINMPPPKPKANFVSNPFTDGERLSNMRYGNRTITINLNISGSDIDDLQSNIRAIYRLLNDAHRRNLLGYGDQVYLQYQWGTDAGEYVYFDILYGELIMPPSFSSMLLWDKYKIIGATLRLECKPFGRYANQDISQATLYNSQSQYEILQSHLTGDGSLLNCDVNNWGGQTITTTDTTQIAGFVMKAYRTGTIGNITGELYATSGGLPTGPVLATGTFDGSDLTDESTLPQYFKIIFSSAYTPAGSTLYAVCVHIQYGDPIFLHLLGSAAGSFAGGNEVYSNDGGSSWAAEAAADFNFALLTPEDLENFQDIETSAAYGDQPAKMYWTISIWGGTGDKKMWFAKRSGDRYDDDLWYEAESFTPVAGDYNAKSAGIIAADVSGGLAAEIALIHNNGIAADNFPGYIAKTISMPRGSFRVLIRARVICEDSADYDHMDFGYGYNIGTEVSVLPSMADDEFTACSADSTWEILDLGLFKISPLKESEIATNEDIVFHIYCHNNDVLTQGEYYKYQIDWIFLLPVDEGVVIADDLNTGKKLAIDNISEVAGVFLANANDEIQNIVDYIGRPFNIGRENTRLYVIRDDSKDVYFKSDVKYQPQFLLS